MSQNNSKHKIKSGTPRRTTLQRVWHRLKGRSRRRQQEDVLKIIYTAILEERPCSLESLAGTLQQSLDQTARILEELVEYGQIEWHKAEIILTETGRSRAITLLRAHRLWEQHLAQRSGFAEHEWHPQADSREHDLSDKDLDTLARQLGEPTHDPHGDPIPAPSGWAPQPNSISLSALLPGQHAIVAHIEDEPPSIAATLFENDLQPGVTLELIAVTPQDLTFEVDGRTRTIRAAAAANVHVQLRAAPLKPLEADHQRLSELPVGATGRVLRLGPRLRGPERRRLLDLGILPGTEITVKMQSPMGDPVAYVVRGAVIALRASQAEHIFVTAKGDLTGHENDQDG